MKTIEVVAAVIKKQDRIFATQRGYGEFKDGWEFPGGKMELGEEREAALIREIKEELDIQIQVDQFLLTINYDYPNFHLTMHCFMCSLIEGDPVLLEHEDSKWLTKSMLDEVDWLPADIEVVEYLKKNL